MRLRATKLAAIGFGGARSSQPSLDLQFAADKTLTARKGPTPVFTRASGATQVNAAGLIEYAPENLILFSNSVTSPAWTKEGGTAATSAETVNGLTATVFNENSANSNHRFYRLNEGLAGISSTFSVWLKAAGRRYVCVNLGANGPTVNSKPVIDLVDREVVVAAAGVTINIQLEANGWARYSFTFVPRIDSGTMPIQSNFSSTAISETGVGLNGAAFYVAGQQYERASTARAYMLTTTTAAYSPRFDHDPVTLACRGLLIEEQRTNFVLNSDLYLTSTPTNITATTITGTSVTGSNQIRELSLTSSGASTGVQANLTGTGTGIKTLSVFIKKPSANAAPYFTIGFASSAVQYAGIQVTMTGSTPVVSVTSTAIGGFSVVSSSIEAFPSGWYRISVVVNGVPASCFPTLYPSNAVWNGISDIRQTLVAAGTNLIYVFGAQVELGSFPTSYIPTAAAAVPRSADVCSIAGSDFSGMWQSATAATILLEANASAMTASTSGNRGIATLSNGAAYSNQIGFFKESGTNFIRGRTPTGNLIHVSNLLGKFKGAIAIDSSTAGCFNGGTVITGSDNIGTVDRLSFADATLSPAGHPSVWVSRYQIYRKRLPNAKLQSLTL
jgi:hypothetical protein